MTSSVKKLSRTLKDLAKARQASCSGVSPTSKSQKLALDSFVNIDNNVLTKYLKEVGVVPDFEIQKIDQKPESLKTNDIRPFYNNSQFNINIVNGKFDKKSSNLPKNVQITRLDELSEKELDLVLGHQFVRPSNMTLINTAFVKDGFLLKAERSSQNRRININYRL